MTTRSRGPLAGFGWLRDGVSLVFRHPKPLLVGAALLVVACLLPTLITMPLQFHSSQIGIQPSPAFFGWITGISMLLGLLIVPLYAGYLQMIDTVEHGRPIRARDIFKPYREGEAWRLIGFALAVLLVYVVLFGIVIVTTGRALASWYVQVLTAQANHQLPPLGLPPGFGITMALFMVLGLFMMGFYSISLGQVALRRRSVFGAIGDGLIGAVKNVLPLLVLALTLAIACIVVAIVFGIIATVIVLLGKLVGAWFVLVLLIPLYIALGLMMLTVMFGVMYCLWVGVCGDKVAVGMAPSIPA